MSPVQHKKVQLIVIIVSLLLTVSSVAFVTQPSTNCMKIQGRGVPYPFLFRDYNFVPSTQHFNCPLQAAIYNKPTLLQTIWGFKLPPSNRAIENYATPVPFLMDFVLNLIIWTLVTATLFAIIKRYPNKVK